MENNLAAVLWHGRVATSDCADQGVLDDPSSPFLLVSARDPLDEYVFVDRGFCFEDQINHLLQNLLVVRLIHCVAVSAFSHR